MWASRQLYIPKNDQDDPDAEFDEAAAALGLVPDRGDAKAPDDKVYLWPCNLPVWRLWLCLQTQWRVGMDGREGLDYTGVATYMREVAHIRPTRRWGEIWIGIQAMELAALGVWRKKSDG